MLPLYRRHLFDCLLDQVVHVVQLALLYLLYMWKELRLRVELGGVCRRPLEEIEGPAVMSLVSTW